MGRLGIVLGACGIHLCIGSVYAWSVLTHPIMESTGWKLSETTFAFSIAILFLGLSAGCLGGWVHRWGARKSAFIATGCFVGGLLGAGYAISIKSLLLLYVFYGCIGGIGLGIGYISPVATLLKWFPEHKGFAGGCAVMSFGFSAMIAGPFMRFLVDTTGLTATFVILPMIYLYVMTVSALMLKSYPSDDKEDAYVGVSHATRSPDFIMLWIIFFINITCGIAILSVASPMGEAIGMNAIEAAGMVGMIGLINGGGRIFFATISDYIGRAFTYVLFFLSETVFFYILANTPNIFLFQSIVFCIVACYGGGFSCMPAYLADIFGTKYLSAIHGRILTAWGIAGLVGPYIITKCYEDTGAYTDALYLFICLFLISLILSIILAVRNPSR